MDTKSRKFSHSFSVRFIAVVMLAVFTLVNSFCFAKLARGVILFGAPALTSAQEPIYETNTFAAATQRLITNLRLKVDSKGISSEDYLAEKQNELAESYASAIATYNEIIADYNLFILEEASEGNSSSEVESSLTQPEYTTVLQAAQVTGVEPTSAVQSSSELATAIETYVYHSREEGVVYYPDGESNIEVSTKTITLKRGDIGYWYYQYLEREGEVSIAGFAAEASGYNDYLQEKRELESYSENNDSLEKYFAELTSVDYYIVDRKTGSHFTNIDGCTTEDAASKALKSSEWYSFYANDFFETNDKRKYDLSAGDGDLLILPALTYSTNNFGKDIYAQKDNFVTASPYYWFIHEIGRYADIDSVENDYAIYIGFDGKFEGNDSFAGMKAEYADFHAEYLAVVIFGLLGLFLFVFLLTVTGKDDENKPKKYFIDRLWNDVHLFISGSVITCIISLVVGYAAWMPETTLINPSIYAALCAVGFTLCVLVFIEWLSSVVRHARMKTYFRHTFCAVVLLLCWRFVKFCLRPVGRLFKSIKELKGVKHLPRWIVAACVGVIIVNFILMSICYGDHSVFAGFLAFVFDIAVIGVFLWVFISLEKIMKAVDDTKNGKLGAKIDIKNIFPLLRDFAINVNTVGDGMQTAVDSAIKDQKTKAELITNVSHDLKTPLTSIVSYVDLLKRCEIEDEQALKYIDILDEKSQRMKKLVEDLVEASKVSSGAVELHPMKLNLCELAVQAVGENNETLEKIGVELRYRTPEQPVYIMADGQKTSRIIENLFSNVQKYAMPETRVYAEVLTDGKFGALTLKNVSRYPLDISAEELTQRFVRGDAARSTEGSGLGLSIAQNLCELQGGKCIIHIDGDLFKVTILLPMAQ